MPKLLREPMKSNYLAVSVPLMTLFRLEVLKDVHAVLHIFCHKTLITEKVYVNSVLLNVTSINSSGGVTFSGIA